MPAGSYELLLPLPDAYESLSGRPEYSIRLANEEMWEESSGYNRLHHEGYQAKLCISTDSLGK